MLSAAIDDIQFIIKNTYSKLKRAIELEDTETIRKICIKQPRILSASLDAEGNNALGYAIRCGKPNSAKCLLDAGADIDEANGKTGWSPLTILAQKVPDEYNRTLDLAELFVGRGAQIDIVRIRSETNNEGNTYYENITPLTDAVIAENREMVLFFLGKGANVNFICDFTLHSPLLWSAASGNQAIIIDLLKHGADVRHKSADGNGVLHWLAVSQISTPETVVSAILDGGCPLNEGNNSGQTPLIEAVAKSSCELVDTLLQKGAEPTIRDNYGMTALDYAKEMDCQTCINLLNARTNGDSDHEL